MRSRVLALAVAAAGMAACSTNTATTTPPGGGAAEVGQKAESTVGSSGGMLATTANTASVAVPAGALPGDVKLSVTVLSPNSVASPATDKQPSTNVESNAYDFGPTGTQFAKPVTLTIKSTKAADAGNKHVLAVLDGNSVWQALTGSSETNGVVTASITHFSQYCVLSVPISGAGCAWQSDPNYCAPLVCDPNASFAGACAAAASDSNSNSTTTGPGTGTGPMGSVATKLAFYTAPPSTVTAGNSFSFTVAVEDANGVVSDSNAPVQFSLVTQGSQPYFGEAVAAVHGYARPLGDGFGPRKAGTYALDVQSPNLTSPATATVQVLVGPASPNSTLVANPASAAVNASVTLTLTAADAVGNVLPSASVAWTASGTGSSITPASSTTDANGLSTATLTASSAGTVSARAAVGSISVLVNVQFHGATQGTAGNSSLFPVSASATADGVHEIQLQGSVLDGSGQPVSGQVTYSVQGGGATVHGGASLDANGNLTATVTSEVGGLKIVTASVGGQQLSTPVFFAPSTCGAPLSQPVQPVLEASSPGDMVHADLDGDQIEDLVASNGFLGGSISVFLGKASGGYGPHTEFMVADEPGALAVADFDGDNKLDVVVASGTYGLSVLLGNGDGTFASAVSGTAFDPLQDLAAADIDQDGKLDLVVISQINGVQVRYGVGDGTFKVPVSANLGGSNFNHLVLGDFDGDTWTDVAALSQSSVAYALYDSTNSVFGNSTNVDLTVTDTGSVYASGLDAGDINADGIDDLAVAFVDSVTVTPQGPTSPTGVYTRTYIIRPFIGSSSGFSAGNDLLRPVSGSVVFADVDGDNKLDVLAPSGDRVGIALGDNTGAFTVKDDAHTGNEASAVLLLDYNSDGAKDLVVANGYAHYVSLVPGVGDGTFPKLHSQSVGSQPRLVLTADLNGDAAIDAVLVNQGSVAVLLNDGLGALQAGQSYDAAANSNITGAVLADATHDGIVDIVAANNLPSGTVQVFAGVGNGTFHAVTSYPAGAGTQSVAVGDVTGDNVDDVVVANTADGKIAVLAGATSGTLGSATAYAAGSAPQNIVLGNLDKDFTLDAVVSNGDGSTVSVLLNSSSGFVAAVPYTVGSHPGFVAVNDVNADYIPDLIVTNAADNSVSLLINDGNSIFTNPNTLTPNVSAAGMAVIDLNADANSEIILAPGNDGHPLVMYASPGYLGYFSTQATYGGPTGVLGLGDISADGYPDFIMVDGSGNLSVLVNAGCSHVSKVGLADYRQSSVVASPNSVAADGSTAAVVHGQLKDVAGHPLAGQTLSLSTNGGIGGLGGGNNSSPLQLTPNPFTTDANGMFSVSITSTTAGQFSLGLYQQPGNNYIWQDAIYFNAGPGASLQFNQPPSSAQSGTPLQYPLYVQVLDSRGNSADSSVDVTLSVDPANGASLAGTLTATASGGQVSFPGITISTTSDGNVVLRAQATGMTDATATVYVGSGGGGGNTGNTGGGNPGNTGGGNTGNTGNTGGSGSSLQLSVDLPSQITANQAFDVQVSLLDSMQNPTPSSDMAQVSVFDSQQAPVGSPQTCSFQTNGQCTVSLTLATSGSYMLVVTDSQQTAAPVSQPITVN